MLALSILDRLKRALGVQTGPEKLARREFARAYPDRRVVGTRLVSDEIERFVVGVTWDWGGIPPTWIFFEVLKSTGSVSPLTDDAAYQPRNSR